MATSNNARGTPVDDKRRTPCVKIGRFLMRLMGVFQICIGPFWFVSEIGFLGRIGRWDLATTMALLTILGFVLLLRPSRMAALTTALVYACSLVYQLANGFLLGAFLEDIVACIPAGLLILSALLVPDLRSKCVNGGAQGPCAKDNEPN